MGKGDKVLCSEPRWAYWIMSGEDDLFRFNLAATEDVLPTPSVLKCWNKITDATCHLCSHANETLRHILCGCQTALGQERQTWRHDSISLALYQHFRSMRNCGAAVFKSKRKPKVAKSSFVSAKGNRFDTADSTMTTPLFEASDGQSKNKPFPPHTWLPLADQMV